MVLNDKTIVITGGTSGIGYQLVKQLSRNNTVIVIARSSERLSLLANEHSGIDIYACDLQDKARLIQAAKSIIEKHHFIDVLINNAAVQNVPTFLDETFDYQSIETEISINFTAICLLTYLLLPSLKRAPSKACIHNVNSGLALAPKTNSAVYCASKAALNSFSRSLSYQLSTTSITVTQSFLPLVETKMTFGRGQNKLTALAAANAIISGIEAGKFNHDIGKVKWLRLLLRWSPNLAFKLMRTY